MGYIYKDSPDWRDRASQSFNDSFSKSLEASILRKQKKKDDAQALAEKISLAGLQEMPAEQLGPQMPIPSVGPTPNPDENYTDIIFIGGKKYGKPLNDYEKRTRAATLKNLEQGSPINYFDPVTQKLTQVGTTSKKGGELIKGDIPKSENDLQERKFQFEKDKQAVKQAEIDKANKAKSDAFTNSAVDALKTINQVKKGINYFGAESLIPTVPGTDLADWRASFNKLTAGKILDVLGNMKNQSKTGASGFGQLNAGELKVITDASTELRQEISEKRATELLDEMQTAFQKIVERESSANSPTLGDMSPTSKIKVKKGNEILEIDASDENDAINEGYMRVQ